MEICFCIYFIKESEAGPDSRIRGRHFSKHVQTVRKFLSRSSLMLFLNFTPQEIKAVLFLLMALLVGSGIVLYQRSHPGFAPELKLDRNYVDSLDEIPYLSPSGREESAIDLNRATAAELQLLPGVGPALSRRIVEYREAKGRFGKIEDVMQVSGIGPKTFEAIKDYLTIRDKTEGPDR